MKDVEQEAISIVVLGRFNPSIFSPAWMRLHNLIGIKEAESASVQIIIPPAAVFSTDWLSVDVREERLMLSTLMTQDFDRLRDVAVGILSVLKETPILALGINREVHWRSPSEQQYHRFGDALAPKEFWNKELILAGTQHLVVQSVRPDLWAGFIRVTVQPSQLVAPLGIFAQFNDHFLLHQVTDQPGDRVEFFTRLDQTELAPRQEHIPLALGILRDEWRPRLDHGERVLKSIVQLSMEPV